MKKCVLIGSIVLAIVLLGAYLLLFSTVTYSGVLVGSTVTDDYIEFTIKDEKTNEEMTILADIHTEVHYCHHEGDIYLGDLMEKTSSFVEINCRRFCNRNKYARSIIVQAVHEG